MTSSLIVAERFGKRHDNIIRDIENIIKTLETLGTSIALSFEEISYRDKMNRQKQAYTMDRDAFSVLVFQ